jgi:hypothetical protein
VVDDSRTPPKLAKALEKVGLELSTIAVDGLQLQPHGKLKRKWDLH